jgi:hypothetical protein
LKVRTSGVRGRRRKSRRHSSSTTAGSSLNRQNIANATYYTLSSTDPDAAVQPTILGGTNDIIAEIFERGGRISKDDLVAVVQSHGYDARVAGILHGRRLAHLRRDPSTGESTLTSRGEEIARQVLFARRLAQRSIES